VVEELRPAIRTVSPGQSHVHNVKPWHTAALLKRPGTKWAGPEAQDHVEGVVDGDTTSPKATATTPPLMLSLEVDYEVVVLPDNVLVDAAISIQKDMLASKQSCDFSGSPRTKKKGEEKKKSQKNIQNSREKRKKEKKVQLTTTYTERC